MLELTHGERTRIFNLGYYTWVEQQGVSLDDFERAAARPSGESCARPRPPGIELIAEFNAEAGYRAEAVDERATTELLPRATRERDRSLRDKVMSLEEAAAFVPDGALVGIGGSDPVAHADGDDLGA